MRDERNRPRRADNVIVMPDIYADRLQLQEAEIEDIELESCNDDPAFGFDPYDTARLYKKKAR
ncbi:MAG: hypothetical protein GTN98_15235 [Woeseiaceae bacterium]|nr:hypothetical protein [Woeseiaceae bacterium]